MHRPDLRGDRFVWIVLAAALLLRVAIMLAAFQSDDAFTDDGPYYISAARHLDRLWFPENARRAITSIGPLYPIFLSPFMQLIPRSMPIAQLVSARLAQVVLDTLLVLLVYLIARRLFGERAGRVALVAQALDLRYIFTAGTIATETLFITLFAAFVAAYLRAAAEGRMGWYALAGLLLAAATLTRPVPLLFPLALLIHALLTPQARRRALRGAAVLTGVFALGIAPWMVRTSIVSGELTPISNTAFVHFWRASREDGGEITSDQGVKEAAEQDNLDRSGQGKEPANPYVMAGLRNILADPLGWLERVTKETLAAYLQPYGTVIQTPYGAGVRQMFQAMLSGEASLADLLAVPALWRRLLMYISHYWALLGGIAGAALSIRQSWRETFPLPGWVLYVTGVTALLLVEPRYLFPVMFVFTVFAAYASVRVWDVLKARRYSPSPAGS